MKIYSLFCALFLSFCSSAQNLNLVADSIRKSNEIPEIAYAIVSVDSILEFQVLGFHKINNENKENKANLNDYFHLGSNTKAITGFIAAYLVEHNKIKWSTKFFELFPSWKKKSRKEYYNITLGELLSHRAGIQPYRSYDEYQKLPLFKGNKSKKRKQFCEYLLKNNPIKPNNETYNYSNAGYSIASLMLEKATGKTWEKLIDEILGQKLKLKYKFGWPNRYNLNQPWGHSIENDTLKSISPNSDYNLSLSEPAGDISMPLKDYIKFIQMNLEGLKGKDNLLKSKTYTFLHYGQSEYSIGWGNVDNGKVKFSEHAGSDGTFYSYAFIDFDHSIAYIILINSGTENAQKGLFDLFNFMKKKYTK